MKLRRIVSGALLALVLCCPNARAQDEVEEESGPSLPITQYAAALVFGALAIGAVLRSSRRQWT